MKATGIVRRIDDLGRIVVPKEIRRSGAKTCSVGKRISGASDGAVARRNYIQDITIKHNKM